MRTMTYGIRLAKSEEVKSWEETEEARSGGSTSVSTPFSWGFRRADRGYQPQRDGERKDGLAAAG